MSGAVLLTGATGFLGMETLTRLIDRGEQQIVVLVRADGDRAAQRRLAAVLARLYDEPQAVADRVRAVRGDLLAPGLGLAPGDRERVAGSVQRIVHCAASISFDLPLEQARATNVGGVARVIELARDIADAGRLRRLVHVSTAYVSGRHEGRFGEGDLDLGQDFRNTYERSKCEAEELLATAEDLPSVIARPSIVVGHRACGWTPAFNVIYWAIRAAERGLLETIPASPDSIVDFVPVDYVTDAVLGLLDDARATGTYNLVAGAQALCVGELAALHAALLGRTPLPFAAQDADSGLPQGAHAYIPYFDVRCMFDDTRARRVLARIGVKPPGPRDYFRNLISYAHHTYWGKRQLTREAAMALAGAHRSPSRAALEREMA